MFCLNKIKQLNIFEQVSELKHMTTKQPVGFIDLLANNFDINTFIPNLFKEHYYSDLGKDREYELSSVLSALLIMQIFHIPTTVLLTIFLTFSTEIREFCGFYKSIPDESFFSRFKTTFESDLGNLFDSIVLKVINICEDINNNLPDNSPEKNLNSMLIYDTSGLKPKVKENNPKTLVAEVNRQKSYAKATNKENFNPYAAAYKNMPKFAQANHNIKLDFVNGHFGYFYKFGLLTNGWGVPLSIKFFDEDFYKSIDKKEFDTPEEQKYFYDNASLKPVIMPFLQTLKANSDFRFKTFLGDSEFDSYDNFGLLKHLEFEKVFIPLNTRNQPNNKIGDLEYDVEGTPLCPLTKEPFKSEGSCKGKNRSLRFKFTCPKSRRDKQGKCNPCIGHPRTVNTTTMRSDLYLTAISKLINVILAYAINNIEYIRSINKLLKIAA